MLIFGNLSNRTFFDSLHGSSLTMIELLVLKMKNARILLKKYIKS